MHKGIEQTVNVKLFEHLLCVVFFFFTTELIGMIADFVKRVEFQKTSMQANLGCHILLCLERSLEIVVHECKVIHKVS